MKKFLIIILATFAVFSAVSCESFFDTDDVVSKNTGNFPANESDMVIAMNAMYASLTDPANSKDWTLTMALGDLLSDSNFPGGGSGDNHIRAVGRLQKYGDNIFSETWRKYYSTIFRTNFFLDNVENVEWKTMDKERMMGDAYFIRALTYFDLVRTFENVPIVLSSKVDPKTPQAKPEQTYSVIFSDLLRAIDRLPDMKFQAFPKTELGRATKWAAEALVARVYLFYSGFYKQDSITLDDGSVLDKSKVKELLQDCIENSGHALISDFRNLWPYSLVQDYPYTKDNNLSWIGEEGANTETVFALKYSAFGKGYPHNPLVRINSIRYQNHVPFGQGVGVTCVNPNFVKEWPDDDMRKMATIFDVNNKYEGVSYKWNQNGKPGHESGYFNKKYITINVKGENGKPVNYATVFWGASSKFQENATQDMVIIRFSDVLLMGAELGLPNAQAYLDQVRSRVQLPSVPCTLENIKNERKYELAFEGVRYYDLLRWGDILEVDRAKADMPVKVNSLDEKISIRFRPETRGFFMIPEDEVLLSEGSLVQNEGWDTPDAIYRVLE